MPNEWGEPTPEELEAAARAKPRAWEEHMRLAGLALQVVSLFTLVGGGASSPAWKAAAYGIFLAGVLAQMLGGVRPAYRKRGRRGVWTCVAIALLSGVLVGVLWWWDSGGVFG